MTDACTRGRHAKLVRRVNALREQHGLAPLAISAALTRSAAATARHMATKEVFGHTFPDGSTPADRAKKAGYAGGVGENILYGQETEEEAYTTWLNSPPHKANMLSPHYRVIGVGGPYDDEWSAQGDVFQAWCLHLGTAPDGDPPPPCRTEARIPGAGPERARPLTVGEGQTAGPPR